MMGTIAKNELRIIVRSKWLFTFSIIYSVLAMTIVYFGSESAMSGYSGFNRTTASLLNLTLFLIPLITLLVGSTSLTGEKEDGGLGLLMTYPIHPSAVIIGKLIGLFLAMVAVISFGYGMAGVTLFISGSELAITYFLLFYVFSIALAGIFLSIALLVGLIATTRFQALSISLFLWAFFVLFYEFVIMGIVMIIPDGGITPIFTLSVLLNPVELIRVWVIISLGSGTIFGPSLYDFTLWSENVLGQSAFVLSIAFWVMVPLFLAMFLLKRGPQRDN